ncbi:MAG: DUF4167 domain-containing protein [Rhodobacterales bacterium]
MRSSNKSRTRNKNHNNNRRGNATNILNRVFDSSGPEGKVRGTPQQIIDKYQSLAHDATLSGNRVNAENFLQHSEHYSRLLSEAQSEINERREAQEAQRQQNQQQNQNQQQQQQRPQNKVEKDDAQPSIAGSTSDLFPATADQSNLVETPENKKHLEKPNKPKRVRQAAKPMEPEAAKPAEVQSPDMQSPDTATQ